MMWCGCVPLRRARWLCFSVFYIFISFNGNSFSDGKIISSIKRVFGEKTKVLRWNEKNRCITIFKKCVLKNFCIAWFSNAVNGYIAPCDFYFLSKYVVKEVNEWKDDKGRITEISSFKSTSQIVIWKLAVVTNV